VTETVILGRYIIFVREGGIDVPVYKAGTLGTALKAVLRCYADGAKYAFQRDTMPELDVPKLTSAEEREAMRNLIPKTIA
jgi:hypothetical protein